MSVDNLAHQMSSYTYNCGCHGNQNIREPKMLATFEKIFGYHGDKVTKTTDFEIPSYRTHEVQ